ncbi:MAG TPA: MinD/ParA family protein [Nautiliaceae bacterium]|nr:MinD/ParA family protein [Nautiliaceae bacterium]
MKTQADKLKELIDTNVKKPKNTRFIAITSGKGGVGKTTITANLGYALHKLGFKVALLDADIGLANLDVILKVNSSKNIYNVLKNECSLKDIIVEIEKDFILIPGKSGDEIINFADEVAFSKFFSELDFLNEYDFFLIDTGAGIDQKVQIWLEASDDAIIVTVPEPAAITDAYAMVKVMSEKKDGVFMLLNEVANEKEAINIFSKIKNVAKANLNKEFKLQIIGYLQKSKIISNSSIKRTLFVKEDPYSPASKQIFDIAKKIAKISERKVLEKDKGITNFFKKIFSGF